MRSEGKRAAPRGSASGRLPWVMGLGGGLLYLVSLNPWVSLSGLSLVARATEGSWQPARFQPVSWLVLQGFRALPERWIPLALNLFSAVCAALVLGLVARAVALWPPPRRRRTPAARNNSPSPQAAWAALLPPWLAAVVCGLQLSFWKAATAATGEMLDVLLLAGVVCALLEFRKQRAPGWLGCSAFLYGAALTNDSLLVGAFPLFLGAVLSVQGREFFRGRAWLWFVVCGVAGLSGYLLLPLGQALAHHSLGEGWHTLRANLRFQKEALLGVPRSSLLFVGLSAVVPLVVTWLPWGRHGVELVDDNPLTRSFSRVLFYLLPAAFLLFWLWMALDPVFGRRFFGAGFSRVTYGFLGALVVGGCARRLLWVSTRQASAPWRAVLLRVLSAIAVLLPLALAWRNLGQVREANGPALREFARQLSAGLPAGRAVVLSDDPRLLTILRAELSAQHREPAALLLDTTALVSPPYHAFLARRYGATWPVAPVTNQTGLVDSGQLTGLLSRLAAVGPVYYLHPSFGYYFESFTAIPQGLVYQLVPRATNADSGTGLSEAVVRANERFWQERWPGTLQSVAEQVKRHPLGEPELTGRGVGRLRLAARPEATTLFLGAHYSRALNDWGVQMQRRGQWTEAAVWFERALELNPGNLVATVNLEFNREHQQGRPPRPPAAPLQARLTELAAQYPTWDDALNADGPVDEPTCLEQTGERLLAGGNVGQAAERLARSAGLAPDWARPRIGWARCLVAQEDFAGALKVTAELSLPNQPEQAQDVARLLLCRVNALRGLGRTNDATNCLESFVARYPKLNPVLANAAELHVEAAQFGPALRLFEELLSREPRNAPLLSKKGFAELQLGQPQSAIATLTGALELAPTNPVVRLNRALAYLRVNQLDAAQADYEQVAQLTPNAPKVLFGLGEIAWRKRETNAILRCYRQYLSNCVPGSADARLAAERLAQVQAHQIRQ